MDFLKMLKCCLDYKVILSVIAVIIVLYLFAPQLAQYSWILVLLICPLSMIIMMAMMNKKTNKKTEEIKETNKD